MQCPRCQAENRQGRRFCAECGAPLAGACPSCGFSNEPGEKFCGGCGMPLSSPRATFEPRSTSPQSYTPGYLAEKILTSKSALEGERKQVTVFFADLKGSMELLADRDPEEARQLLDPVLERMMAAVHHYEGTVNQVLGDGIMALFGAPIAHEDHAMRACYAALQMQEAVERYAGELRRRQGLDVQIRVGLNSGEVVVRAIGSDLHMDYTAVGQTTHMAARMEQLARPGTTLITADTLRLVEGFFEVTPLGPVPVKGLTAPVEIYELVRPGVVRSRLQAAAARGLTRFVARETELEQLRQASERANAGHGQVVAVIGEPGVGKSRLVWEFTHLHRTDGWLILESGSVSYGKATPYLPVIDLLKAYFQVEVRDDVRKIREKATGKLLTLDEALRPTLPAILNLLDLPVEDAAWQDLDPPQRRQRILEAVKRLLLRESQVQPLLLVCEDLHWIDAETQALLDSLVESLPTARLFLLVNYRPEYQHSWGGKTYYTQLRLDPLPTESAAALLQALLGDNPSLEPLKQRLIERTEGNPFFLEESVRTLVETQVLVGERGAYRLPHARRRSSLHESPELVGERAAYRLMKAIENIQVPATVQAVLAARIDRLPPEAKRLLQTAAVVGMEVPFALLHAIAELAEDARHRGLTHLQAAEFLYETALFPELEYTFKHALTHEVAYGSLLHERRRTLHARIVEAIEGLYPNRLAEEGERLAHHALRGEVWDKALVYLRQAGAKALARSANWEAETYFEQALIALQHLPESRDTCEQAIDLRLDLRYALWMLGDLEKVLQYLREAETLAETLNDHLRLGRVSAYMTSYFWVIGDYGRAIESGQRALAMAREDVALQVRAKHALGRAYHALGDYHRAMECYRSTIASLEGDQTQKHSSIADLPSVDIRAWLVWCLAELGEFAEGLERGEAGVQVAEAGNDLEDRVAAFYGIGLLHLRKGDLLKATPVLERGLSLSQGGNLTVWFPALAWALGYAYTLSGRVAESLPLLESAVELDASMGVMGGHSLLITCLSEGYLRDGRVKEAMALAGRALELSRTYKERGNEAYALHLLGEIAAYRDPPEMGQAEASYRQARVLAEELGMRPLLAHCHLGLGVLYGKIGWLEQARAQLSAAVELYHAMEMTFWLTRAEAALAEAE